MEGKTRSIFIVDDEPDILEFLTYNLKKEGYIVNTALDGEDGLQKIKQVEPDLVILDIMMPKMDGVEVCRQLREDDANKDMIIVFLTARNEDYSQIAGFEVGADDYITKPIRPRVFVSRVKALLRRKDRILAEELGTQSLVLGNLEIDREKFIVRNEGKEIYLAKKEFELIELLSSKPGKVFTREEIFNKVWGAEVIVGNRTIDVHVRKLREKIGDSYIKTVKGIGYKFEF
ncbi:MAG: two-component system alkaline phosphatase synthesis response regulator PhoP [Maribacter sp.]|jgi:two-component system alkaline phosphatase synthesis response regulator PhoP